MREDLYTKKPTRVHRLLSTLALTMSVAACGSSNPSNPNVDGGVDGSQSGDSRIDGSAMGDSGVAGYRIGGSISGLAGSGFSIRSNGQTLMIAPGATNFTLPSDLASGTSYNVEVQTQPSNPAQICVISNGQGVVSASNITNVSIACTTNNYRVGGMVSGLNSETGGSSGTPTGGLVLQLGSETLEVFDDGTFAFPTAIPSASAFSVSIASQPTNPSQTCTLMGATGTVGSADVSTVAANCTPNAFSLGGTVSGLSGTVVLRAGTQTASVTADGQWAFPSPLNAGTAYEIQVETQPEGQTCTVTNGSGTIANAPVANASVACVNNTYTLSANVSGLQGGTLTLANGTNSATATADSVVLIQSGLTRGAAYEVVATNPTTPPQTCSVTSATGTVGTANIVLDVACSRDWSRSETLSLTNEIGAIATPYAVLVNLPSSFDYSNTTENGGDLRFSTQSNQSDSLPYFIESWNTEGTSQVWVLLPTVPEGNSQLFLFYGNPRASTQTNFAAVFPNAFVSSGSLNPVDDIVADSFELASGHTLTIPSGRVFAIRARRLVINGTIVGDGAGQAGGELNATGQGGVGGGTSSQTGGAGGGGYGGRGGNGAGDSGDIPGFGGAAYGTAFAADILMGSGGGGGSAGFGGAGGGAINVEAWLVRGSGSVSMNGMDGSSNTAGRLPGGGSGGGVIFRGGVLDMTGMVLSANGGTGGRISSSVNDGGGGGGGGRLKAIARISLQDPFITTVDGGTDGGGGDLNGESGQPGTRSFLVSPEDSSSAPGVLVSFPSEF